MEQHAGDFSVTVRDVRQLTQPESDLLTLLWVLEGSVNLAVAEGASQPLAADGLAIVNRNRRWSLRSAGANAVMILTLSASWLARLDNAFFAVDYQITPRTRDADDGLRRLMRQLLVSGLVNHPGHYRLEANRWLSEIALLLATRFSQPIASTPRRDTEKWSRRIASVVARIDANYQRRLSLQEVAAAEFVSEAWLSRLFRKEVGVSFVQYLTALRLRHAADQLLTTRKTVQQIAREQGFASTRMMSDLFKRQHGVTPRQYREQHPLELARPRPPQADRWQPVAADRLYARLNEPEPRDRESPPLPINPPQTREINLRDRPARPAALRHTRMVVTVRELDDLLREDVRRELEQLHHALPVYAIDINDPFLSSRLFGTGWDDPQIAGYACWYNLQQIFSWLAAMGWQVILHTGVTTRSDLLQRFLQLAAGQRSCAPGRLAAAARGPSSPAAAAAAGDLAPLCSQRSRERSAVPLAAAGRGGFSRLPGRCQRTAGSGPGRQQPPGLQRTLSAAQAAADPQRPAPASAQPAAVAALLEYADRRYAGYQRPLFSRRAADG